MCTWQSLCQVSIATPGERSLPSSPSCGHVYDRQGSLLTGLGWVTHSLPWPITGGGAGAVILQASYPEPSGTGMEAKRFSKGWGCPQQCEFSEALIHRCSRILPTNEGDEEENECLAPHVYSPLHRYLLANSAGVSSGSQFRSHPLWQKHSRRHLTWPFQPLLLCLFEANSICHSVSGTSDTPFHAKS